MKLNELNEKLKSLGPREQIDKCTLEIVPGEVISKDFLELLKKKISQIKPLKLKFEDYPEFIINDYQSFLWLMTIFNAVSSNRIGLPAISDDIDSFLRRAKPPNALGYIDYHVIDINKYFDGEAWYSLKTMQDLTCIQYKRSSCLRYVFQPQSVSSFAIQFKKLRALSQSLKVPAYFIFQEPASFDNYHYCFGVLKDDFLLVVDPMKEISAKKRDNQDKLLEAITHVRNDTKLKTVYWSGTMKSRRSRNHSESTGIVVVEFMKFFSERPPDDLMSILDGVERLEFADPKEYGVVHFNITATILLPPSLGQLSNPNEDYDSQILTVRQLHSLELQNAVKGDIKAKGDFGIYTRRWTRYKSQEEIDRTINKLETMLLHKEGLAEMSLVDQFTPVDEKEEKTSIESHLQSLTADTQTRATHKKATHWKLLEIIIKADFAALKDLFSKEYVSFDEEYSFSFYMDIDDASSYSGLSSSMTSYSFFTYAESKNSTVQSKIKDYINEQYTRVRKSIAEGSRTEPPGKDPKLITSDERDTYRNKVKLDMECNWTDIYGYFARPIVWSRNLDLHFSPKPRKDSARRKPCKIPDYFSDVLTLHEIQALEEAVFFDKFKTIRMLNDCAATEAAEDKRQDVINAFNASITRIQEKTVVAQGTIGQYNPQEATNFITANIGFVLSRKYTPDNNTFGDFCTFAVEDEALAVVSKGQVERLGRKIDQEDPHSEEVFYSYLKTERFRGWLTEKLTTIQQNEKYKIANRGTKYNGKVRCYSVVLDIHSSNNVCDGTLRAAHNCQKLVLQAQSPGIKGNVLDIIQDCLTQVGIEIPSHRLRMVTRISSFKGEIWNSERARGIFKGFSYESYNKDVRRLIDPTEEIVNHASEVTSATSHSSSSSKKSEPTQQSPASEEKPTGQKINGNLFILHREHIDIKDLASKVSNKRVTLPHTTFFRNRTVDQLCLKSELKIQSEIFIKTTIIPPPEKAKIDELPDNGDAVEPSLKKHKPS